MNRQALSLFLALTLLFSAAGSTHAESELQVLWKEGLRLQSADKAFEVKIGGRIMNDWIWNSPEDTIEAAFGSDHFQDGTEFRRARLYVSGQVYDNVIFKAQYDFAGAEVTFKDVYMGIRKIPGVGTVKMGHFKEPFSLEELTSSNHITFMERAFVSAFVPSRNTGMMIQNTAAEDRLNVAVGIFRDVGGSGDGAVSGKYNATARLAVIPWNEKDRGMAHIGAAYSYRDPNADEVRYQERPEVHTTAKFVDTGAIAADAVHLVGGELAVVYGPASLQGEYVLAMVDAPRDEDPRFAGFYVFGSYFLTGEQRAYKTSSAAFDRVKPKKDFSVSDKGYGAWEITGRYSSLDLNDEDAGVSGGELGDVTVGLSWYLNPNAKIMLNYVYADLDGVGTSNFFQTRFQINF